MVPELYASAPALIFKERTTCIFQRPYYRLDAQLLEGSSLTLKRACYVWKINIFYEDFRADEFQQAWAP
jgi:hypothetical protein